jgi:sirohydrochlorin ferrochelatase
VDGLILFSHGSVLCGAGENLKVHAALLRGRHEYAVVEIGYMNYSKPAFETAVERCAEAGVSRIVVVPYFLVPGKFVKVDLPKHINAVREKWPALKFVVCEAIGYDERLADALLELARHPKASDAWREDLETASHFCERNPTCPLYGTLRCKHSATNDQESTNDNRRTTIDESLTPQRPMGDQRPTTNDQRRVPPQKSKIENRKLVEALLVMVHGSPREIANEPMHRVVERVRERGVYPIVEVGFMECNAPDIPTAIMQCVEQGAERIIALPYFLHTGKHVADDLPTLIEEAEERYPEVEFQMVQFLGCAPQVAEILAERGRAGKETRRRGDKEKGRQGDRVGWPPRGPP